MTINCYAPHEVDETVALTERLLRQYASATDIRVRMAARP